MNIDSMDSSLSEGIMLFLVLFLPVQILALGDLQLVVLCSLTGTNEYFLSQCAGIINRKYPVLHSKLAAFYFSLKIKMYTLNDKSTFLTWTVQ